MGRKKSLTERIEMFKKMKEGLLRDFQNGADPVIIGQLLTLVEATELKDTGDISSLEGNIDMTEKEFNKKIAQVLGKKGGESTLKKYGKVQMKKWGKRGGRPKKNNE